MLFRNKCAACDYWTIFELKIDGERADQTCTHCQATAQIDWNSQAETLIRDGERDIQSLERHFPVLGQLKARGDHIRF